MIPWSTLSAERRLQLREAYARSSAGVAGTCSLDIKIARFSAWLAARGIAFGPDDLPRPPGMPRPPAR